ncbi:MAG: hypothetical protein KDM63_05530 [Verrucomicrobiae bacterium]|nr:hypothetical protein [Verrucomicrobiae bacterium]MCB1086484.1 hypothetical protein [Verrucomicrobiae bacterium]
MNWPCRLLILAASLSLSSCASAPATSRETWRANRQVDVVVAPFWKEFPPFAGGLDVLPNRTLGRGTPVRFLRNHFGFAEVQLESMERGWMPQGMLGR